jgi:hypothetical protein
MSLAAELRPMVCDVPRIQPAPSPPAAERPWIVTLATPAIEALDVLEPWEREMLSFEQRLPGCRFLGWRTRRAPAATDGPTEWPTDDAAGARWRRSQRERVIASLLRCPSRERRGVVHGRGVPR